LLTPVATDVAKDLVLYKDSDYDPSQDLLSLAIDSPILVQLVVASAAMHMGNRSCTPASLRAGCHDNHTIDHDEGSWAIARSPHHQAALAAKQHALERFRKELDHTASARKEQTLVAVLLFIELDLIESRQHHWKEHIRGFRAMAMGLSRACDSVEPRLSALSRWVIANCVV